MTGSPGHVEKDHVLGFGGEVGFPGSQRVHIRERLTWSGDQAVQGQKVPECGHPLAGSTVAQKLTTVMNLEESLRFHPYPRVKNSSRLSKTLLSATQTAASSGSTPSTP